MIVVRASVSNWFMRTIRVNISVEINSSTVCSFLRAYQISLKLLGLECAVVGLIVVVFEQAVLSRGRALVLRQSVSKLW